jgi:hypothetical protein
MPDSKALAANTNSQVTNSQIHSTSWHILTRSTLILSSQLGPWSSKHILPFSFPDLTILYIPRLATSTPHYAHCPKSECYHAIIHEEIQSRSSSLRTFLHPALYPAFGKAAHEALYAVSVRLSSHCPFHITTATTWLDPVNQHMFNTCYCYQLMLQIFKLNYLN